MDPVVPRATTDAGSCCAECAAAAPSTSPGPAPVVPSGLIAPSARRQTLPARRGGDRRIAISAIAIAAAYVALAALSLLAPASVRLGWWLPLHLLLAGAAATAIAGVMPFFSASVASVPAAPAGIRVAGVAGIAIGALLVVLVRLSGGGSIAQGWPGAAGGGVYLVGIGAVAAATLLPLRVALGPRRMVLAASYGMALLYVALGAGIGTLALAGWGPLLAAWDVSKPAHAWLNVFGFLSLVIGATLIHLLPTVAGTRIERSRSSNLVLGCLMVGPVVVAVGFLARTDILVVVGSLTELVGAAALLRFAAAVVRRRGRWTTDLAWHRMSLVSLLCAIAWFSVATFLALATAWSRGATAFGWDGSLLLAPLALGWAAQALVGSWTHLVPSIGPGSPVVHARQRQVLGTLAVPRMAAFQLGVGMLAVGMPPGNGPLTGLGVMLTIGSLGVSITLLVRAVLRLRAEPRGAVAGGESPVS